MTLSRPRLEHSGHHVNMPPILKGYLFQFTWLEPVEKQLKVVEDGYPDPDDFDNVDKDVSIDDFIGGMEKRINDLPDRIKEAVASVAKFDELVLSVEKLNHADVVLPTEANLIAKVDQVNKDLRQAEQPLEAIINDDDWLFSGDDGEETTGTFGDYLDSLEAEIEKAKDNYHDAPALLKRFAACEEAVAKLLASEGLPNTGELSRRMKQLTKEMTSLLDRLEPLVGGTYAVSLSRFMPAGSSSMLPLVSASRMATVNGTTRGSSPLATKARPSTALSTEIAGVIMPSP